MVVKMVNNVRVSTPLEVSDSEEQMLAEEIGKAHSGSRRLESQQ
eukprot:gene51942-38892_t